MTTITTTTHYYFYETNADRGICVTDGKKAYFSHIDSQGNDTTSNINICDSNFEDTLSALKTSYTDLYERGLLYDFDSIETDFSDEIKEFHEDDFERIELIIDAKTYLS